MTSPKGKRPRKSRGFGWSFVWLLALLITAGAGIATSDITQLVVIRVEADEASDRDRLIALLRELRGRPALQVSGYKLEREVERNLQVESSDFRWNLFGRARLAVTYRQPVARLEGGHDLALDQNGAVFPFRGGRRPTLTVSRTVLPSEPILSLCDPSRLRAAAKLAKKLQVQMPKLVGKIALDERGGLCLNSGGSTRVAFGGDEQLGEKVALLRQALAKNPNLFKEIALVTLTSPDQPMQKKKPN